VMEKRNQWLLPQKTLVIYLNYVFKQGFKRWKKCEINLIFILSGRPINRMIPKLSAF
jgi:hypothetical protein